MKYCPSCGYIHTSAACPVPSVDVPSQQVNHWRKRALEAEARVAELEADIWRVRDAYNELIMAVGMKFPDESRHQTALRYIQHRESGGSAQCAALAGKEGE